jgi:hypothetical protein
MENQNKNDQNFNMDNYDFSFDKNLRLVRQSISS